MSTQPPTYVLVSGPEEVMAERGVASVVTLVREQEADAEVVRLYAGSYTPGDLGVHASPSLFGGWTVIVVHDLDEADDALLDDVMALLAAPADGVTLIVRHKSGNRGKRVLDALRKAGARVIEAKAIKSEGDKLGFVMGEFQTGRRRIERDAALALVHAVGKDVRELAGACEQLIRDTTGSVGVEKVETYYGERVETTGFKVAEAALAGNEPEAMRLLRHAMTGGLDPVPIVAVLAMQLRQVGRVGAAGRASSGTVAKDLGIAPWQVDQARRVAQGWDGHRLGRAIQAVAAADVEVKGGLRTGTTVARSPEYAVERAVMTICRERRS
ncbi:MAG: DNA polymerase III subunit delta [Ornithinimicrobium sp.]|uniref:DNA polymerase III subunit delta n=1 Tax=Ornithinimicrobium sp. TaxID=1977084 RepID=UPI003D9BA0AD